MQNELFQTDERSAILSNDRVYRYTLWRRWSGGKRFVQFIGINPSTADESHDDPTIRKCVKFAKTWGYDAICMTNLFAYRSTDKQAMLRFRDPVGFGNDRYLLETAKKASLIVCVWGRDGGFNGRAGQVCRLLSEFDLYMLRITQTQPHHPLYLPDATRPKLWKPGKKNARQQVPYRGRFDFSNSKTEQNKEI